MTELAKWVWIIILVVLFIGPWIFALIAFDVAVYFLIMWLKPEWLEQL